MSLKTRLEVAEEQHGAMLLRQQAELVPESTAALLIVELLDGSTGRGAAQSHGLLLDVVICDRRATASFERIERAVTGDLQEPRAEWGRAAKAIETMKRSQERA